MLENMKTLHVRGDLQGAHRAAVDAAPYLHAKLVSSQVTIRRPDEMSDDELIAAIAVDEAELARLQGGTLPTASGRVPSGTSETRH
jgi:hypothetical protein